MPDSDDDLFGENENEAVDEFDRLTDLLFQHISEFADDEEVPDELLPLMLLRLFADHTDDGLRNVCR